MKTKHTARPGTAFNDKDAKIIGDFLDVQFPDGVYTPKEVVNRARPKSSPIHRYFEWDNTRAAELYRCQQARKLISCLFVEVNGVEDVPKAVSVYVDSRPTKVYVNTDVAADNKDIWKQVLVEAIQGLRSWKLRYERFEQVKELRPVFKAIEEVHKKYENKKAKIENKKSVLPKANKRKYRKSVRNPSRVEPITTWRVNNQSTK